MAQSRKRPAPRARPEVGPCCPLPRRRLGRISPSRQCVDPPVRSPREDSGSHPDIPNPNRTTAGVLATSLRGDGGGATTTGRRCTAHRAAIQRRPPQTPSLPPQPSTEPSEPRRARISPRALRLVPRTSCTKDRKSDHDQRRRAEAKTIRRRCEYRENKLKSGSAYRKANRAKINAHRRQKYATDSEFRAKKLADNAKRQRKQFARRMDLG
jgi:hypothetical protein